MGRRNASALAALLRAAVITAAALLVLLRPQAAKALETDQFTVPPRPLADIGPELALEVMARIDTAAARLNARAAAHARRAERSRGFWQRHHLRAHQRELSEGRLALEVYRELAGPGLPECRIERWVRSHRFRQRPARFEMSCGAGAYGASPLGRSPFLVSLSPTVNAFGVYCGADKVGHLFQQGYQYFDRFSRAESRGRGDAAALAGAVKRGIEQERGFYGRALVGVYSNADLAANYAGLKLYLNLTRPVQVGDVVRPPLLVMHEGQWLANPGAVPASSGERDGEPDPTARAEAFLQPFVSDHFNEALNPSRYSQPTRDTVRSRWRQRAAGWVAFYASTHEAEAARLASLATWHGERYGHSGFAGLVTAPDTCFDGPAPAPSPSPSAPSSPPPTSPRPGLAGMPPDTAGPQG